MTTISRYERELAALREHTRELGHAHPLIGHLLAEREGDASVERMLQGSALLASRVSERLDDELPEVLHPLFERLWPQYLRPIPPVTMLQLSPAASGLTQAYTVPSGTVVRSKKVDGNSLEFRTVGDVEVPPAELTWVGLERPRAESFELSLELTPTESASFASAGMKRLRLYFAGQDAVRAQLYHWLLALCRGVVFRRARGEAPFFRLGPEAIAPIGFGAGEALREGGATPLLGFGLLEELFAFRDRLWGVELSGLEALPAASLDDRLVIGFELGALSPIAHDPTLDDFLLGVVPAVGISGTERVDFELEDARTEFRVEPPSGGAVYSVERVGAYDMRSGGWSDYVPLAKNRDGTSRPRFEVRRRRAGIRASEVVVAIADAEARPQSPEAERLSVWDTATQPDLAGKLGLGDVTLPAPGMPAFLRIANVSRVSAGVASPLERGQLWALVSLFTEPTDELLSLRGIRRLISEAYPEVSDIAARLVVDVTTDRSARLEDRMMVPLLRVSVRVSQSELPTPGEAYLFGRVLHRALSRPSEVSAVELRLRSDDPRVDFTFG